MNGTRAVPAVEVLDLRFTYPSGQDALRGVSLSVMPGEKVALVGPNGAGKSTLALHLNGILSPSEGDVRIMGHSLAEADARTVKMIRGLVGLLFQDPDDQLFSTTVHEDVAFGPIHMGLPEDEVERRVQRALAQVGLEGYGPRMPHHLSGGEKRRAAIATTLSMDPSVLVADEPSAGLDPRARRSLINLLRTLPQTMIVATHDMRLARDVLPRTVVMDQGKIVADGPTAELLSDEDVLAAHGLEAP
ncbi:MAG: energy-coupling factor ABC transporter ATP-binding protein [Chloroflexota bacterium]